MGNLVEVAARAVVSPPEPQKLFERKAEFIARRPDLASNLKVVELAGAAHRYITEKMGVATLRPTTQHSNAFSIRSQAMNDDNAPSTQPRRSNDDSGNPAYKPSASAVTLSPDARDIAKACGMTEIEYARQVLRLRQAKRDGLIPDH
jgi:hypothetical protein